MSDRKVAVFFYGSYINLDVLAEVDLVPETHEVATLFGYDIVIKPRANIIESENSVVYGILTRATHGELERLYTEHAKGVLDEEYLPEAVLVTTESGMSVPCLCYISDSMKEQPADADYVDRIVVAAMKYGFPASYIEKLESFRSV